MATVRIFNVFAGAGNFSVHHRVQNGSGAHPASYPMGTSCRGKRMSGAIPPFPNTPPWRGAQLKHRDKASFYCLSEKYGTFQGVKERANKMSHCRLIIDLLIKTYFKDFVFLLRPTQRTTKVRFSSRLKAVSTDI
jgi:hypothetical protein